MKIWDRENKKKFAGFRDMADFLTGNLDPIPPLGGPPGNINLTVLFLISGKVLIVREFGVISRSKPHGGKQGLKRAY